MGGITVGAMLLLLLLLMLVLDIVLGLLLLGSRGGGPREASSAGCPRGGEE
jgi:hypothetical protein